MALMVPYHTTYLPYKQVNKELTNVSKFITSAGSSIAIGKSTSNCYSKFGFQAVADFTEIAEVTDIGEFGKKYNQVTHSPLSTRQIIKRRGSYDNGTVTIQYAYAPNPTLPD